MIGYIHCTERFDDIKITCNIHPWVYDKDKLYLLSKLDYY